MCAVSLGTMFSYAVEQVKSAALSTQPERCAHKVSTPHVTLSTLKDCERMVTASTHAVTHPLVSLEDHVVCKLLLGAARFA